VRSGFSEVAPVVAPLLFPQLHPQSAIYAQQQSCPVTMSDSRGSVTVRNQFAVIESSASIEAPDGILYVVRSRSRAKKKLVVGP
jgi:hypothetical protein